MLFLSGRAQCCSGTDYLSNLSMQSKGVGDQSIMIQKCGSWLHSLVCAAKVRIRALSLKFWLRFFELYAQERGEGRC